MTNQQHIFTLEDGQVKIKGIYVGLATENSKQMLFEQGFTIADGKSTPLSFKGNIEGLGICDLMIREGNNKVVTIVVSTERKCTEEEALAVLEQVKTDLHAAPGYDYNDFGLTPSPNEIDYFWDLCEGLVTIKWDGYNTHGFSFRDNDGLDYITFGLEGPIVKDEEYWRSEVD